MAKSTQVAEPESNPTADQIAAEGVMAQTIEPVPAEFDPAQLQSIVSRQVAEALGPSLLAVLPDLLARMTPQQQINGPSGTTHVPMVADAPAKPNFLKHYRMDGVISGKYQLVDPSKLDENGEIEYAATMGPDGRWRGDTPAIVKGQWIHFQNEHFYATKQIEVDFVEWKIKTDPQFRAYEDKNVGGEIRCYVQNCGKMFADQETLNAHLQATHGV